MLLSVICFSLPLQATSCSTSIPCLFCQLSASIKHDYNCTAPYTEDVEWAAMMMWKMKLLSNTKSRSTSQRAITKTFTRTQQRNDNKEKQRCN